MFLATDLELRQRFYTRYISKIPAITQFCFNSLRLGPISDESSIVDFGFLEEYRITLYCCAVGTTVADKDYLKLDPEYILDWFRLLEIHFTSGEKDYLEWVDFERVPYVSNSKNYLCALTVTDGGRVTCSETSYFHEHPCLNGYRLNTNASPFYHDKIEMLS